MESSNFENDVKDRWGGRPYYALDAWLKYKFGTKVYKLSLDAGMTCPNRDGTKGRGGCIFCSAGGSGEFAAGGMGGDGGFCPTGIARQIAAAKERVIKKMPSGGQYIAYFQSYTNTYADVSRLRALFTETLMQPDIAALSIATRPDCLEPEKIQLLAQLNKYKPVWVELGLQTIHARTAEWMRRGYPLSCFEETARRLKEAGLTVVVHLILGLPGESREQMLQSVDYLAQFTPAVDGVKLQLLHILKGTDLAALYAAEPFPLFSMEEYVDFVITCLERLPPSMVIHRLTGDGPKKLLLAPAWSADKKRVLNTFARQFRVRGTWQGAAYHKVRGF